MTVEHADRPGRRRLVLDPGVFVSAAISGVGAPAQLLGAAIEGRVVLLASSLLLDELREVLGRPKLGCWLTSEDAQTFVEGVELLGESVQDHPRTRVPERVGTRMTTISWPSLMSMERHCS